MTGTTPEPTPAKTRDWLQRGDDPIAARWRIIRRSYLAATIALFPFLFILDARTDMQVSPVLPGIVALLILWIAGPFITMELVGRFGSKGETVRGDLAAKIALGAAALWFLFWLVLL